MKIIKDGITLERLLEIIKDIELKYRPKRNYSYVMPLNIIVTDTITGSNTFTLDFDGELHKVVIWVTAYTIEDTTYISHLTAGDALIHSLINNVKIMKENVFHIYELPIPYKFVTGEKLKFGWNGASNTLTVKAELFFGRDTRKT